MATVTGTRHCRTPSCVSGILPSPPHSACYSARHLVTYRTHSVSLRDRKGFALGPCAKASRIPGQVVPCSLPSSTAAAQPSPRLQYVLDKIDEANSHDPRTIEAEGTPQPYELAYSRWLTHWVHTLTADGDPPLTEEMQIVARGQHVERWRTPRSSYPEGKASYLKWREDLKKAHASRVVGIMQEVGYPEESLEKVRRLILKRDLKQADGQVIEDALCLVFLQHQFAEFRLKESRASMLNILRKTWGKMGPKGHAAAMALSLGPAEGELVTAALTGSS